MGHPCLTVNAFDLNAECAVMVRASGAHDLAGDGCTACLTTITMPLCRIAEKLGIQGISANEPLPSGFWIADGSGEGKAYSWPELVYRMTERMSR
jgi:hypothetical protein